MRRLTWSVLVVVVAAGWVATGSLARAAGNAKDDARVRRFLASERPGRTWQEGPTVLDSAELRAVFPGQRFYFVLTHDKLPSGIPTPSPGPGDAPSEASQSKALSAVVAVDGAGKVRFVDTPASINRLMRRPRSEATRKRAAAAVASLQLVRFNTPQPYRTSQVERLPGGPELIYQVLVERQLMIQVYFDTAGRLVRANSAFLGSLPPTTMPAPSPEPHLPLPTQTYPVGAIAPRPRPCEVSFSTRQEKVGKQIQITALATNVTRQTITMTAPDACPAGPVRFAGLPEGYDYYRTCNKGACAGPREAVVFTLPPGKTVELGSVLIDPAGANCTARLAPGRYEVSFSLPSRTPVQETRPTCGVTSTSFVAGKFKLKHPASVPDNLDIEGTKQCPPPKTCGNYCPHGPARDPDGCSTCACAPDPLER